MKALTPRQTAAYQHLLCIIRPSASINASTGLPGDFTYALIASNVPSLFVGSPNIDTAIEGAGRFKAATLLTMDEWRMAADVNIRDADIIKDVSILPDGTHSQNYGAYARVEGAPRIFPAAGRRQANCLSIKTMTMEKVPTLPI